MNRDLKPENLLLKKKYNSQEVSCTMENLRCVDFGSASQLEAGAISGQLLPFKNHCEILAAGYCWMLFSPACLLLTASDFHEDCYCPTFMHFLDFDMLFAWALAMLVAKCLFSPDTLHAVMQGRH